MEKYAIGIDVGGTKISTAIVNSEGKIIEKKYIEHNEDFTVNDVIRSIYDEVGMLIMDCSVDPDYILGIGMGLPGIVDYKNGTAIKMPNIKNGENVNFKTLLEDRFSMPVLVDNDV
ncbi:ROK family protein, partial [bacterium]|nr:ROK family protein [bacterium]